MLFIILLIIQLFFTGLSIYRYFTAGKFAQERGLKWYKEQLDKWTKEQIAGLEKFRENAVERQNLLSKENAKLIEENEKYRSKLKNLGFSDITLDN